MVLGVAGDLVEDVVVRAGEATRRGADASSSIVRRRGGSAANVAAAAAALGQPVRLVTAVGADRLGADLVAELEAAGVSVVASRSGRTGTVVVVVDADGQRTMYSDRAAAADLRLEPAALVGVDLLHLTGYALLPSGSEGPPAVLADLDRRDRPPLSLDVSSLQVIERVGDLAGVVHRLAPAVVFANADEAEALGWDARRRPRGSTVVVKRGPEPALVLTDSATVAVPAVDLGAPVPDTTGAGDAFAAGYLVAVLAGSDPVAAAAAGHRCAAAHLRRLVR